MQTSRLDFLLSPVQFSCTSNQIISFSPWPTLRLNDPRLLLLLGRLLELPTPRYLFMCHLRVPTSSLRAAAKHDPLATMWQRLSHPRLPWELSKGGQKHDQMGFVANEGLMELLLECAPRRGTPPSATLQRGPVTERCRMLSKSQHRLRGGVSNPGG